jgi:pentatricopeptide repeat protein
MLETDASISAGFHVWKQLVVESAKRARQNTSRWELVQRVLKTLTTENPKFWPDHVLLKYGLEASEFLLDSKLASTLIARILEHERDAQAPRVDDSFESTHFLSDNEQFSFGITAETNSENRSITSAQDETVGLEWAEASSADATESAQIDIAGDKPTHDETLEQPPLTRSRVVFRDILKGMEICVHNSDMRSGRLILDSVETFPEAVPVVGKRALYTLALKGFASIGDFESAEELLSAMIEKELNPG